MRVDPKVCSFCGGRLHPARVDVLRMFEGRIYLFKGVPAEVCDHCGEQYYTDHVVAQMDEVIKNGQGAKPVEATMFTFPEEKEAA
jgi:YgiT-type zinc finger domain-containing protein